MIFSKASVFRGGETHSVVTQRMCKPLKTIGLIWRASPRGQEYVRAGESRSYEEDVDAQEQKVRRTKMYGNNPNMVY